MGDIVSSLWKQPLIEASGAIGEAVSFALWEMYEMIFSANKSLLNLLQDDTQEMVFHFWSDFILGAPKALQMATAAMKLKDTPWKQNSDLN